jgi:hypothetical protein
MVVCDADTNMPDILNESEQRLTDEIKSIMSEIFQAGVFSGTMQIVIMTPKIKDGLC